MLALKNILNHLLLNKYDSFHIFFFSINSRIENCFTCINILYKYALCKYDDFEVIKLSVEEKKYFSRI